MMLVDYHNHTSFSGDCTEEMEAVIIAAIEKKIKIIAITEHLEIGTALEFGYGLDVEKYIAKAKKLKEQYKNYIDVVIGIEVGFNSESSDDVKKKISSITSNRDIEFVINSTHSIGEFNFLTNEFFEDKSKDEAYYKYLEQVLSNVNEFEDYDIVAHLDFICRYGDYKDKSLDYAKYFTIIDEILMSIIRNDKGIEVNTSGVRYGRGDFYPSVDILKRYRELGGKKITIGSDSHKACDVGCDVDKAIEKLKSIGYEEISIVKNREWYFMSI